MRFTINGYEIDLKVKGPKSEKSNKRDLRRFLTDLAIMAMDAEELNRGDCCSVARMAQKYEDDLTAVIDKLP